MHEASTVPPAMRSTDFGSSRKPDAMLIVPLLGSSRQSSWSGGAAVGVAVAPGEGEGRVVCVAPGVCGGFGVRDAFGVADGIKLTTALGAAWVAIGMALYGGDALEGPGLPVGPGASELPGAIVMHAAPSRRTIQSAPTRTSLSRRDISALL